MLKLLDPLPIIDSSKEHSLSSSNRLHGIDGLRGLAALVIVVYHLFTCSGNPEFKIFHINVLRPMHDGWCGVDLFLVLSGLCLYWPYAFRPTSHLSYPKFMTKRARRILPAYYICLAIVALLMPAMRQLGVTFDLAPKNALDVFLHLFMLHSLNAETFHSWHSVTWSLGLEWIWYLFFPLVVVLFRRVKAVKALLLCALITLSYRSAFWFTNDVSHWTEAQKFMFENALPGRLFDFAVGMFAADLLVKNSVPKSWIIKLSIAVPVLLVVSRLCEPIDPIACVVPVRHWIYSTAFGILCLLVASEHNTIFGRLMKCRWFSNLGESSYSLYLFHLPVVLVVCALLNRTGMTGAAVFGLSLLSIPLILKIAELGYKYFEKPFLITKKS
jgi:exopolysaccharide production protein ExoZ